MKYVMIVLMVFSVNVFAAKTLKKAFELSCKADAVTEQIEKCYIRGMVGSTDDDGLIKAFFEEVALNGGQVTAILNIVKNRIAAKKSDEGIP